MHGIKNKVKLFNLGERAAVLKTSLVYCSYNAALVISEPRPFSVGAGWSDICAFLQLEELQGRLECVKGDNVPWEVTGELQAQSVSTPRKY